MVLTALQKIFDPVSIFVYRVKSRVRDFIYGRFIRKPYLINTGLPKSSSWYDKDTRMLYGMMSLLVDYIEKEKPFEHIDWDDNEEHRHAKREMQTIYDWWKSYPELLRRKDAMLNEWYESRHGDSESSDTNMFSAERLNTPMREETRDLFDALHQFEARILEEEQDMLHRLIEIRGYLWT